MRKKKVERDSMGKKVRKKEKRAGEKGRERVKDRYGIDSEKGREMEKS